MSNDRDANRPAAPRTTDVKKESAMMNPTPATPRAARARSALALAAAASVATLLAGCFDSSSSADTTTTVQGDVPIAYVMRANTMMMNPTNGAPTAPGGDLFIREKASPSAPEHNITASITQGAGDVSDPEVSYDGKKLVFSLRCPTSNTSTIGGQPACTGHWNLWEYDMTTGGLTGGTFRRITSTATDDDVDPAYLPGGRGFVFSSNRQTKSHINQALGQNYYALDEYERERVFNLHTVAADGSAVTQISFNQSHDRNPVVRPNGDIMFSRWDHVGNRNHFKIFRIKPDGTDLFVLYGAHSEGNSFLHPRDMDPKGKYAGQVTSDLMPLSRSNESGALMFIDVANYSEQNTPINASVPATGGQVQATAHELSITGGLSQYGMVTTPYPLWDGTDRVLLAFRPCEVSRSGVVASCTTLTDAERTRLSDPNRTPAQIAADPLQTKVPPRFSIYMFDPAQQTWLNIATPPAGFMYTDPVAIAARTEPNAPDPTPVDADLASQNLGLLEVRSVYDTDGLGRMGDPILTATDLGAGCTTAIAKTVPTDTTTDTRAQVADLVKMKDPANAAYGCAPARFIRAVRAVAPPDGSIGLREAIGETDFEPQQILGYAPIEPDGSFRLQVPADTPIGLAVVDAEGRAFQTHTNWIQVRPGERRTCDGCHSPRRGGALNSGSIVDTMPAALTPALASAHQAGETMADTRARLDPALLTLMADMVSSDSWADTTQPGVTAKAPVTIRYTGNPDPANDLKTLAPVNGIIDYPANIQPLWTRDRGANTCITCHTAADTKLNLTGTKSGTGRLASYESLLLGPPVLDAAGKPTIFLEDGVPMIRRQAALVDTMASEGDATGLARKSRLMEIMAGVRLKSADAAVTTHPTPVAPAPDHSKMLNAAEKRLIAEWMDLGGKYFNNPFNVDSSVRQVGGLLKSTFQTSVFPILNTSCGPLCHQARGSSAAGSFFENRFVLTGDPVGDYGTTLSMISDVCTPPANYLLSRPSTIPHPDADILQTVAVLPTGSAHYNTIADWIITGCPTQ
jgi:hypothetical protein